jgi:hypothetical protein
VFVLVTDTAAVICWFLVGDIFKGRADSGFAAESKQILGLHSPPPLSTSPFTNQQVRYAHVLRTGMTTGTLSTICVQVCGLLRADVGCRRPGTKLLGADIRLVKYVALSRPLAVIVILSTVGQARAE